VTSAATATRAEAATLVASQLLPRASLLTRLLLRRGPSDLTRAEAGLLSAVADRPHRITEIAAGQALAQPTVTQLVARLDGRGLVARDRSADDGRVVLVSLTGAGRDALQELRSGYQAILLDLLADRDDDEIVALATATDALQELIDALQAEVPA